MTDFDGPEISDLNQEVYEVYRNLATEVAAYEQDAEISVPDSFDVGSVHEALDFPLTLWESGRKPTRTVPALVAYEQFLDRDEREIIVRILAGLDAFVGMLDEFIDTDQSDRRHRTKLAVNVAFSSLLSFSSIPEPNRDVVVDALSVYFVEASRIPAVEQEVARALKDETSRERAMELIRFVYGFRARDISVFGTVPALVSDVDIERADRIENDLRTFRAHCLLYDDVRDIEEDLKNGIETPVMWLLDHYDPEEVAAQIEAVYQSFEYSNAEYTNRLCEMEPGCDDLVDELALLASRIR
ncbi:hypothetical protein E6P09_15780 (plasmid) [Haloferax mediterranei ATCC 33500]|uniref:Polyprenyl synthetase n=1 Tax=Haloferax mediterranei (strain ATCC 33500 / DSM 1411 / JCM 8866 / NBRC 14739 / NCIMB 2177 / R-4) TaxID=523841 RepID=I3RBE9_HALMT|nr:hypothetical protein [Haloferax mediterranei]AFK21559.1 hypothetical protein HFX_6440 [Haloferax mediterranei ATCC 33500]AHZ24392.1 hypothetical protein BM92_15855 [Haloferax mediterranei ATCC 33500]ELZ97132.1 hypothetical protein C439_17458 [Haloferax mediterranei ATCC 33500]MDX5990125.1 hypothetical protein [Haloferax mediterranei ATCC 33500]QCQ76792.1 hypothetical protein E6P09_15780 [Haloferax mediterranei ATCC 33500]